LVKCGYRGSFLSGWQRRVNSLGCAFTSRGHVLTESGTVMMATRTCQFLMDLREAHVWHRRTGETRRWRAAASAWRTALVLASKQSNWQRPNTYSEFEWQPARGRRVDIATITRFARDACLRCAVLTERLLDAATTGWAKFASWLETNKGCWRLFKRKR
jgi:hypothetical protein